MTYMHQWTLLLDLEHLAGALMRTLFQLRSSVLFVRPPDGSPARNRKLCSLSHPQRHELHIATLARDRVECRQSQLNTKSFRRLKIGCRGASVKTEPNTSIRKLAPPARRTRLGSAKRMGSLRVAHPVR